MIKKISYYMILATVTATHFLVTFVVALLLMSSLNILNERILHLTNLNFLEILITAVIFISSIVVYFRSFKKTALIVRESFFRDMK